MTGSLVVLLALTTVCATAQNLDQVVVTASRIEEPAGTIPAEVSIVGGAELRARGATDMASALSLVPGVEAPAGGDAGPSSAVPSFWGLHEFDAFLLVVDGVPWGGAYNPAITTLDFNDVDRVEVLKGAAPVMYGATSFVGVVQVLHLPAGEATDEADFAYGTHDSVRGAASMALPQIGAYRESVAVNGQSQGYADAREKVADEHVLYRGALDLGTGKLRIDADLTFVRDVPPSPVLRSGAALATPTRTDANFNPADARIDEDKYHLALGYSQITPLGVSDTLVSFAYSSVTDVRAFLHPDFSGTADTQHQRRTIDDGYLDTHLTNTAGGTTLIVGADLLYGHGRQTTLNGNGAYTVPLDGSVTPPPTSAVPVNEIGTIDDRRDFAGQYGQAEWKHGPWNIDAGVRLNEAVEYKRSSDLQVSLPPTPPDSGDVGKTMIRATETLGVSYRAWSNGKNQGAVYADVRNAFKPAAIDFGPDYTPDLLSPETATSYEAGLKGAADEGRFTYQAELFLMDFRNLVVATSSGALANAAGEKLRGMEAEAHWQLDPALMLTASGSYHRATYTQYLFFDGTMDVNVAGRTLPLAPHVLAAAGVAYTPHPGLTLSGVARYVGPRFLDEENTAPVGGYTTLDAQVGYAWDRYRLALEGSNLTNRRPPVSASEFGSQSFYLLSSRQLWVHFVCSLRRRSG